MSKNTMHEAEKRDETLIQRRIDRLYKEVAVMAGQRDGGSPECDCLERAKEYLKAEHTNLTAAESLLDRIRGCILKGDVTALDLSFILGETIKKLKQDLVNLNYNN